MHTLPLIPENAPFTATQRLWLNGYLAGLFGEGTTAENRATAETLAAPVSLLILYGSQTGTAEKLAKTIAKEAKAKNLNARVMNAADHAKVEWKTESKLLVVTSTYGDGDVPDNAQAFWEWLQTDSAKSLAHLSFSILALGDTNYEQFCAAGKKFDARLELLGAKRIHPLAECDLDYEAKSREWTGAVLEALASLPSQSSNSAHNCSFDGSSPLDGLQFDDTDDRAGAYDRSNPFPARLLANHRLNDSGSQKETRHFEISLNGSNLNYEAGDALGVLPQNCPAQVAELLQVLGCKGDEPVTVENREISFDRALLESFDISKPSADLLHRVACHNPELRDLLAEDRKDHLKQWLLGREIIDLLLTIRNGNIPPREFITLLKKLTPRLYSISSSPKAHPGEVHLTVGVIRYQTHGRARKGIASTFLADRTANAPVPVYIQAAHGFRLPPSGDTPVIMVGPGTGVAPFRAFLHERRAIGATGRNWLFFGEQRAATDFYYRDELQSMVRDGHLTKLSTAFSRDQSEKIYVQHRMLEEAAGLWAWLENGAHFYVCGDASRMAKDVDQALHEVIQIAGGKSAEEASVYVAQMRSEKRYQRDVY